MTRLSIGTLGMTAALGATLLVAQATPVNAQCATCPQPVVAFSPVMSTPVVTQPVVVQQQVVRTGWYPGAWIDRMRMRRWDAATTTVAAAPTYTAGYAPAAMWAQPTITTVNRPVITAFAPMQPVVQTSFMPVISSVPVASPCSSCPQQVTAAFAPTTTVLRPVEVTPIVQTVVAAPACSACSTESPCGGCSTCSGGVVSQASFAEAAPVASDCPSCAASSSPVEYYGESTTSPSTGATSGPATPQPQLPANVPTPAEPAYPGASSAQKPAESSVVDPKPEADDATGPESEPETDPATDASTSYEFQAPPLVAPQNDRTANRPTVDVHNAVYSQPARQGRVSTSAAKVATAPAAPATDANGWYSVSER